ncbi:MAG: hypothetical protein RL112_1298 [Planctomycetota bacterium]
MPPLPRPTPEPGPAHAADVDLVRRAGSGEQAAMSELVGRMACVPAMLRALHRRLGSPLSSAELEDVDGAVMAALWPKLRAFEGRAALESWIYRFVQLELHKALERRRRHAAEEYLDEEHRSARSEEDRREPAVEAATIQQCLDQLGPPADEIVRLRHFEDMPFDDIARRQGEPVNTIKARYYRGIERLKRLLEPHVRRQA